LLSDVVPIYPLYALMFTATGLSIAQISGLFAIWSAVALLTEVPSGALADRFSRRSCLVASDVLQAAGYVAWVLLPGFHGFALGFVLWGFGGSLASGAKEALLYDGLAALGAGAGRLPATLTAGGRQRPRMVFAEIGAPIAWSVPLHRFAAAERPSTIVTSPSTPHLLREAARALAARLAGAESASIDVERTPPHIGAPDRVAELSLALAGR
jgi:MFS family permease